MTKNSAEKQWFVFYTKSRQEKKVKELLMRSGFEPFLPTQMTMRQWSDRKKKVEMPLFSSYIFVKAFEHNIPEIVTIPGIAWNIRHNNKPAVLREHEYELINRFISTGFFIETASYDSDSIKPGDQAEVIDGPLAGVKGVLTGNQQNLKFNVLLESINHVIRVQIPAYLLKKR